MTSLSPIYHLDGVHHHFGSLAAVRDIDLRIDPGQRVAIIGQSGAGKSTLLRLLNGGLFPTSGRLMAFGQDLAELSPSALRSIQRRIGTIYQQFNLVDELRVVHNVNAGHLGRWPLPKAILSLIRPLEVEVAARALRRVGIPEKLYERTDRLSGGQQQRVAIARVLVQSPDVILADEPIASLDPERGREVLDLLCDLSTESGITLISSLHAVGFALSHFERIIGLRNGRLMFDLPADELTESQIADLYRIQDGADGGG